MAPVSVACASRIVAIVHDKSSKLRRQTSASRSPAVVKRNPRPLRSNKGVPIMSASRLMRRLIAAWVRDNSSAAARTVPHRAVVSNARKSSR